ncbi:MAG: ThuA domain-containing protein [Phycisphaerales bacterium JB063]
MLRTLCTLLPALLLMACTTTTTAAQDDDLWVTYEGTDGLPGSGKHIVLISGDDEYRSEEALPQLGKILATQHGFTCTVLFAIDPDTGFIQPDYQTNIPGMAHLDDADLVVMSLRFRNLPDEQMAHFDAYLKRGGPIVAMRTSTHAFNITSSETYKHYTWNNGGQGAWNGGFGRNILGETWINHHGHHKVESTRGIVIEQREDHPIVRGIEPGSIWGPSDVYGVRLPQPEGCVPLVVGAVLTGMSPDDEPVDGAKNTPMMPIAWTKPYQLEGGAEGTAFTTTMGAATDLEAEGTRRMIVNAAYWLLGMADDIPAGGTSVDLVGDYAPSQYGFGAASEGKDGYIVGRVPSDYAMEE